MRPCNEHCWRLGLRLVGSRDGPKEIESENGKVIKGSAIGREAQV